MKRQPYASVRMKPLPRYLSRDHHKAAGVSSREGAKASQQLYQKIQVLKATEKAQEEYDTLAKEADLERTRAQILRRAANSSDGKALEKGKLQKDELKKQVQREYDILVQELRLEKTEAKQYQTKSAASAQGAEAAHWRYELKVEELKKAKHACDTLAKQTEVHRTRAKNWRRVADATGRKAKEISQEIAVKEILLTELLNAVTL